MVEESQKKKVVKNVFLFLIKFNLLLIPFYVIIYMDIDFYTLQTLFAHILSLVLRLLGYKVSVSGFFMFVGDEELPIDISRDCIGWKSTYSLFALVLATKGKLKEKLKFLLIWIPVLLILNFFRVLLTIICGLLFGVEYLELIHAFIWQVIMMFVLLGIWYIWLRSTGYSKRVKE